MLDYDSALGALTGMVIGEVLSKEERDIKLALVSDSSDETVRLASVLPFFAQSIDLLSAYLQADSSYANMSSLFGLAIDPEALPIQHSGITSIAVSVVAHHRDLTSAMDESIAQGLKSLDEGSDLIACEALAQLLFEPDSDNLIQQQRKIASALNVKASKRSVSLMESLNKAIEHVRSSATFESCLANASIEIYLNSYFGPILGQLAGAHFGIGQIPLRWLDLIPERKQFLRAAHALFALNDR